jgi:hypothetical protein
MTTLFGNAAEVSRKSEGIFTSFVFVLVSVWERPVDQKNALKVS